MNTARHRISFGANLRFGLAAVLFALCGMGCGGSRSPEPSSAVQAPDADIQLTPRTNMVPIRAGMFVRVKFPVTLTRDYWMAQHEVTQSEFLSAMGRNPSHFTGDLSRPVEKVTFVDAMAYCARITRLEREARHLPSSYEYRLPTEAEWEYACLAGSTNRFSFGEEPGVAAQYAWTGENSDAATHPVGMKKPNAWGLYDMHGNVWEWCSDWFEPYPAKPLVNPVGPVSSQYKLFKGGGWNQDLEFARSVNRFMMSPSNGIHFVGFRVALGRTLSQLGP
jgi:formylglycine-generating enzyme required for sulfatase activity